MTKYIIFLAIFLGWNGSSLAQTVDIPAAELNSTPPALTSDILPPAPTETTTAVSPVKPTRKMSYGLSAGTQFSRLFGTTTYLEPSVMFPITKRLSGFASLSLITTFGSTPNFLGNDDFSVNYTPMRRQNYVLNAGGNYIVNNRLNLTGSIWRDLSKSSLPTSVNLLMPGGTNGMSLRANYKVTENFSVSGGFRYSNGNSYQSTWYHPTSPYGF